MAGEGKGKSNISRAHKLTQHSELKLPDFPPIKCNIYRATCRQTALPAQTAPPPSCRPAPAHRPRGPPFPVKPSGAVTAAARRSDKAAAAAGRAGTGGQLPRAPFPPAGAPQRGPSSLQVISERAPAALGRAPCGVAVLRGPGPARRAPPAVGLHGIPQNKARRGKWKSRGFS